MTDELKAKFTEAAGDGFITMQEATRALGVRARPCCSV